MLVAFDTETTGLNPGYHEVIEIGAIVLQDNGLPTGNIFTKKLLIEHPDRVEWNIMGKYNHYDADVWQREGVPQRQGWFEFSEWLFAQSQGGLDTPQFLGHNVAKFDYMMMHFWCTRLNVRMDVDYHPIDTINIYTLWKQLTKQGGKYCNLKTFAKDMDIENPSTHSALHDAGVAAISYAICVEYMRAMIECGPHYKYNDYINEAMLRLGIPRQGAPTIHLPKI